MNVHNPQWLKSDAAPQQLHRKYLAFNSMDQRQGLHDSSLHRPFSHGTGQEFDMTEYEVLGLDQLDSKGSLSKSISPSESESTPITLSLTPQSSPPSTPSPPPTPTPPPEQGAPPEEVGKAVQTASSSPQLRLVKRKAPEVHRLVHVAAQLLPDANCPSRAVIYSPIH